MKKYKQIALFDSKDFCELDEMACAVNDFIVEEDLDVLNIEYKQSGGVVLVMVTYQTDFRGDDDDDDDGGHDHKPIPDETPREPVTADDTPY